LPDFTDIVRTMKKAGAGAVEASSPMNIVFGTVTSAAPLRISVEQKLALEGPQLILSRSVTDHYVDMAVAHATETEAQHVHAIADTYTGGGASQPTQHLHAYSGTKKFRALCALKEGEQVALIRVQGGQKYFVLDRLGGSPDAASGQHLS